MLKIYFILFGLSLNVCFGKDYSYEVAKNDQLGIILFSLGHRRLWSKDGMVNQFKKIPKNLLEGAVLRIPEKDIIFKQSVIIQNDRIKFVKKFRSLTDYNIALKNENISSSTSASLEPDTKIDFALPETKQEEVVAQPEVEEVWPAIHSFNFYPGIGAFLASNTEYDRDVTTRTLSGLQPMIQLKGIYSSDLFGSLSIDFLTKKIVSRSLLNSFWRTDQMLTKKNRCFLF